MVGTIELFGSTSINNEVVRIALAVALGLFLGLEREWSQKEAGIRTFALISVLGTIFTLYDGVQCSRTAASQITLCIPFLSAMGGFFVIIVAGILMYSGLATEEEGLHLTTAVSMLVAYGVGVLVAVGHVLSATVVTVTSSVLLVFKRELHGLAWGLSREEIRSASEFAILAFVIYPLLPADSVTIGSERLSITLEPRVVWLMVVFVAAIGIVNYAIVKTYDSRGIAVTGFFGGLASSTAVVGTMLDHVRQNPQTATYGVAAILLADAAMALRNLVIALVFTLSGKLLLGTVLPLGV
ncbi:MAG: MgtC/SapB family protein, partial [Halobacteriaceae archaeon]